MSAKKQTPATKLVLIQGKALGTYIGTRQISKLMSSDELTAEDIKDVFETQDYWKLQK